MNNNSPTKTDQLVKALKSLSSSIQSEDGVANVVIFEGADKLENLKSLLEDIWNILDNIVDSNDYFQLESQINSWQDSAPSLIFE